MTSLITSDLHLTDQPRDEYRWGLFPWLLEQVEKYNVRNVFLLGDLTDAKDRHNARLVNRLAEGVSKIAAKCSVDIIPGNHDAVDMNHPFFAFLDEIPRVSFYQKPGSANGGEFLLLPHTKNYAEDWSDWKRWVFPTTKYILCHQTFDGAKAENGQELSGIPPSFFKAFKGQVYSGDVHVPQKVSKNTEYVGAPYRIHFGDAFEPRVLLLRKDGARDLHFPTCTRELLVARTMRDLQKSDVPLGTQVKVRVLLKRSEYPEWPKLRKDVQALARERGWDLCGGLELVALKSTDREVERAETKGTSSPEDALANYADAKKLPKELRGVGLELLKEAQ